MDTVLRVVVIYMFLVAALRVLGKREFQQLSPAELIMLLITSELVSPALTGNEPSLVNSLVAVATLFILVFLSSLLTFGNRRAGKLLEGSPVVLVHRGRLLERNLAAERITAEDVLSEARKAGLAELERVRWAILETDGAIAIIPEEQTGS